MGLPTMLERPTTTTSAPSVGDFLRVYAAAAQEASGIVSIHLSPKFSAPYNSAFTASQLVDGTVATTRGGEELVDHGGEGVGIGDRGCGSSIEVGEVGDLVDDAPAWARRGPRPLVVGQLGDHVVERLLFGQ